MKYLKYLPTSIGQQNGINKLSNTVILGIAKKCNSIYI